MKNIFYFFLFVFSIAVFAQSEEETNNNREVFTVVPTGYENTAGTSSFTGPLASTARTYQLLINENQITNLVGQELRAISFRLPASATAPWPAAEATAASYDIYLSGSVPPSQRSFTFSENVVGPQTQVRSGSYTAPVSSYPSGSSPNAWGPEITLTNPYLYSGGHLLIEIRHSGVAGSTSRSTDAIGTSVTGYGTDFSALWASSTTPTTGSQGNFSVVRIKGDNPIPVELSSFVSSVDKNNVELRWATSTETNNKGFEVERSKENNDWQMIGFVNGNGTTTELKKYSYKDENLAEGKYSYRLKQLDFNGTYSYHYLTSEVEIVLPKEFLLHQNYPNPFNPSTTIKYSVAEDAFVSIAVYNALGEKMFTIVDEYKSTGQHEINFDASALTSGVYYYRMDAGEFTSVKRMLLVK